MCRAPGPPPHARCSSWSHRSWLLARDISCRIYASFSPGWSRQVLGLPVADVCASSHPIGSRGVGALALHHNSHVAGGAFHLLHGAFDIDRIQVLHLDLGDLADLLLRDLAHL